MSIQGLLFVAFIPNIGSLNTPEWPELWLSGIILTLLGIVILTKALIDLNKHLSPFPTPKQSAQLITSGIYKNIRHPIYSGILALTYGIGLATHSGYRLIIATTLFVLFIFKSRYEETLLIKKYKDYSQYKETTGAFFPSLKIKN